MSMTIDRSAGSASGNFMGTQLQAWTGTASATFRYCEAKPAPCRSFVVAGVKVDGDWQQLPKAIKLTAEKDGVGAWEVVCPEYGIDVFGESFEEVRLLAVDQLSLNIREIALEDDAILTSSARDLKAELLRVIGAVGA